MSVYTYLSNVQIAIIGDAEPDVTKVSQFFWVGSIRCLTKWVLTEKISVDISSSKFW